MNESSINYKVIHQLPGRIRLRIPRLLIDAKYRYQLENQLQSYPGITQLRVNPLAQSLMVCYDRQKLSFSTLQPQLRSAIQSAILPSIIPPTLHLDQDFILSPCENLSDYEKQQIREIDQWLAEDLGMIKQGLEKLFQPVGEIVEQLLPSELLLKIFQSLESITNNWEKDWESLKSSAGVENHHQLQEVSLEKCDRLAEEVKNQVLAQAAVEGGLSGLFGWLATEIDLPLSVLLMWQTIHKIGLCYGYTPAQKEEKQFAWAIVELAISDTADERKKAFKFWFKTHQIFYPQMLEDWVEESAEDQTTEIIRSRLIKQTIGYLMQEEGGEEIPVLGCVFGLQAEVSLIKAVSKAAYRTFQTRWLIDNQKLELSSRSQETGDRRQEIGVKY